MSAIAYVGLGSNLADPIAQLRAARAALAALPDVTVEQCSSLYRTAPVGLTAQPDFINAVCQIRTSLDPQALMMTLLSVERRQGRVRNTVEPGGPRVLDLDLLVFGNETRGEAVMQTPGLTLPHPRLHERAFVLYPLAEIAPDLMIPGRGAVAQLLPGCAGQDVQRLSVPF